MQIHSIEQLRHEFQEVKQNPSTAGMLFQHIWQSTVALPKAELKALDEEILAWAQGIKNDYPLIYIDAFYNVGFVDYHSENYEAALQRMIEATQLYSEINYAGGIARCNMTIGGIYRTMGELDLALKYLLEATMELEKTGTEIMLLGICHYGQAGIYYEAGNYTASLEHYERCHNYTKGVVPTMEAYSLDGMGDVYRKQKQYDLAIAKYTEAENIIRDQPVLYSRIITDVASYYLEKGDYVAAIENAEKALSIRRDFKIFGGAITNLLQLVEIFKIQENYPKALEILNEALEIAESLKVKPKIFQIHKMFSEIYGMLGDHEKRFFHYEKFHSISQEVFREDAQKKIKNMEMIFEAEQTKKENAIIKAQKIVIENKNIELQKTIDELTLAKISKKAKMVTLTIAVCLFIIEDALLHCVVAPRTHHSFLISLGANGLVVFALKPIERIVEHYLLHRFVKLDKEYKVTTENL